MGRAATGIVVFAVSVIGAGACGDKSDQGVSFQSLCEADVECIGGTVEECVAESERAEAAAVQAGCVAEMSALLSCVEANPSRCDNGYIVNDERCDAAGNAFEECFVSSPDALCSIAEDPCEVCICEECPCDTACASQIEGWIDCVDGCMELNCLDACDEAFPAVVEYLDCGIGPGVCDAECEVQVTTYYPDGGSIDPCDCALGAYTPACGVDGNTYDATCGLDCVPVEVACQGECPCM